MATIRERIKAFLDPIPVAPLEAAEVVMRRRYQALCDTRDQVNAQTKVLQVKLDEANKQVQEAQREAQRASAEIQTVRGGKDWIDLKKEIGLLARALSGK